MMVLARMGQGDDEIVRDCRARARARQAWPSTTRLTNAMMVMADDAR